MQGAIAGDTASKETEAQTAEKDRTRFRALGFWVARHVIQSCFVTRAQERGQKGQRKAGQAALPYTARYLSFRSLGRKGVALCLNA